MFDENVNCFFSWARERHQIYLNRKAGMPWPWTSDPIYLEWRFCNVFRELDTTTQWFRENVREPLRNSPEVLFATIAFRWFNKIETGEVIKPFLLEGAERWDKEIIHVHLENRKPIVTGSYIIKTPDGMNKLNGVLWCIEQIRKDCENLVKENSSLEHLWTKLKEYPFLGGFMSYEIVSDLRHTELLESAPDIMTWANPGPGATRGTGWVFHNDPDYFNGHSERDRKIILTHIQELLELSKDNDFWPQDWLSWEMREVEHWLCETFKIAKIKYYGGRTRQKYRHLSN